MAFKKNKIGIDLIISNVDTAAMKPYPSNPTIEGGGDFGFPSPASNGDVIKTAPSGDGYTYLPTSWASAP